MTERRDESVKRGRDAVEAFERACDELVASGVVFDAPGDAGASSLAAMVATADGTARKLARAALQNAERRAAPIAVGDVVVVHHLNRNHMREDETRVRAVGRSWLTTEGGYGGRFRLDTGVRESLPGARIDPHDLVRIRRDLAGKRTK